MEYKNFELGVLFHSGEQDLDQNRRSAAMRDGNVLGDDSSSSSRYVQYKAYNRSCMAHSHPILGSSESHDASSEMSWNASAVDRHKETGDIRK